MKLETDISDDKLQNLSPTAKSELGNISKLYIEEVLDEASRIEESRRTSNSNPEVTAAIINDAAAYAKSHGIRKRKPKREIVVQGTAFVSATITGGLFDTSKFQDIIYVVVFLVVFAISVVATLYLILNDSNND